MLGGIDQSLPVSTPRLCYRLDPADPMAHHVSRNQRNSAETLNFLIYISPCVVRVWPARMYGWIQKTSPISEHTNRGAKTSWRWGAGHQVSILDDDGLSRSWDHGIVYAMFKKAKFDANDIGPISMAVGAAPRRKSGILWSNICAFKPTIVTIWNNWLHEVLLVERTAKLVLILTGKPTWKWRSSHDLVQIDIFLAFGRYSGNASRQCD